MKVALVVVIATSLAIFIESPFVNAMDQECLDYLVKYKYIPEGRTSTQERCNAMYSFKEDVGLFEFFGDYLCSCDEKTKAMMSLQRCGANPYLQVQSSRRLKRYVHLNFKWRKTKISWRLMKNRGNRYTSHFPDHIVIEAMEKAFKIWSDVCSLEFVRVDDIFPDIELWFLSGDHGDPSPFDGIGGTLAHTFVPTRYYNGLIHFDEDEEWTFFSDRGSNLMFIAIHEIGHALGMGHSTDRDAVMYTFYRNLGLSQIKLSRDDIKGIQSLYGKAPNIPTNSSTTKVTTMTPTHPARTPTTSKSSPSPTTRQITTKTASASRTTPLFQTSTVRSSAQTQGRLQGVTRSPVKITTSPYKPRSTLYLTPRRVLNTKGIFSTHNPLMQPTTTYRVMGTYFRRFPTSPPHIFTVPKLQGTTQMPRLGTRRRNPTTQMTTKPNKLGKFKTTKRPGSVYWGPNVLNSQSLGSQYNLCQQDNIVIDAITSLPNGGPTLVFDGLRVSEIGEDELVRTRYISDIFIGMDSSVDAAVSVLEYSQTLGAITIIYLFKRFSVYQCHVSNGIWIVMNEDLISNKFDGLPNDIDAALYYKPYRAIFAFKGSSYYKIDHYLPSIHKIHTVVPGYPQHIAKWGLPDSIRLSGVFTWNVNSLTYFFVDDEYYRFDDLEEKVDTHTAIQFPRRIENWWFGCSKWSQTDVASVHYECPPEKDVMQILTINSVKSGDKNEVQRSGERCKVIKHRDTKSPMEGASSNAGNSIFHQKHHTIIVFVLIFISPVFIY